MNADGRRIDRDSVERMLDAVAARRLPGQEPDDSAGPLARLLTAATAPATPAELAGEDAAAAAFRALAANAPSPAPARRRPLFSLRVAGVALALTTGAGAALTSATNPLSLVWDDERQPPGALPSGPSPSAQDDRTPSGTPSGGSPRPSSSPDAKTVQLCRTYTDAAKTDPQGASRQPVFAPLVAQAGGTQKVHGYCNQVLQAATRGPKADDSASPGNSGNSGNSGKPEDPGSGNSDKDKPDNNGQGNGQNGNNDKTAKPEKTKTPKPKKSAGNGDIRSQRRKTKTPKPRLKKQTTTDPPKTRLPSQS